MEDRVRDVKLGGRNARTQVTYKNIPKISQVNENFLERELHHNCHMKIWDKAP